MWGVWEPPLKTTVKCISERQKSERFILCTHHRMITKGAKGHLRASISLKYIRLRKNVGTVTAACIMVKEDAGARGRHTRSMAHKDFFVLRNMENNGNIM